MKLDVTDAESLLFAKKHPLLDSNKAPITSMPENNQIFLAWKRKKAIRKIPVVLHTSWRFRHHPQSFLGNLT